jgi:hypothetical protein
MAKNPARLNDSVSNNLHGDGEITSGATAVSFQGQSAACEGDSVKPYRRKGRKRDSLNQPNHCSFTSLKWK